MNNEKTLNKKVPMKTERTTTNEKILKKKEMTMTMSLLEWTTTQ